MADARNTLLVACVSSVLLILLFSIVDRNYGVRPVLPVLQRRTQAGAHNHLKVSANEKQLSPTGCNENHHGAKPFMASCPPIRHASKFVKIPLGWNDKPVAEIQKKAKGYVEFSGCTTPRSASATLTSHQWDECCKDWGHFTSVQYPRDSLNREYKPDPKSHVLSSARGTCYKSSRILLVVLYNHAYYNNSAFLRRLYGKEFAGLVFYGPDASTQCNVTGVEVHRGYFQHRAIAQAMLDYPGYGGYLWTGDDVFLNYPALLTRYSPVQDRIWFVPPWAWVDVFNRSQQFNWMLDPHMGAMAVAEACVPRQHVRRLQSICKYAMCLGKTVSDVGYVPAGFVQPFLEMAYAFRHVFGELALPTLLKMIMDDPSANSSVITNLLFQWAKGRNIATILDKARHRTVTAVHPLKFSNAPARQGALQLLRQSLKEFPCLK